MKTRIAATALLALSLSLTVAACTPAGDDVAYETAETSETGAAADASAVAEVAAPPHGQATPVAPPRVPAPVARIAYAYRYALALPRDQGASLMSRHELACVSAGPDQCQVMSAQADWAGQNPSGRLELRGAPMWINAFRAGLADEARAAGGRLNEAATEGEDLTRGIRTSDATIRTSASLNERLKALQARRGFGNLAQRTQLEREVAGLEQQIARERVELQTLNDRVETARLSIDYRPSGVWAADSRFRPVAGAVSNALGVSMGVLAILIAVGSAMLPIALLGGVAWWAVKRRRRTAPTTA